jgi:20S proteasome alpha/beta subunit
MQRADSKRYDALKCIDSRFHNRSMSSGRKGVPCFKKVVLISYIAYGLTITYRLFCRWGNVFALRNNDTVVVAAWELVAGRRHGPVRPMKLIALSKKAGLLACGIPSDCNMLFRAARELVREESFLFGRLPRPPRVFRHISALIHGAAMRRYQRPLSVRVLGISCHDTDGATLVDMDAAGNCYECVAAGVGTFNRLAVL